MSERFSHFPTTEKLPREIVDQLVLSGNQLGQELIDRVEEAAHAALTYEPNHFMGTVICPTEDVENKIDIPIAKAAAKIGLEFLHWKLFNETLLESGEVSVDNADALRNKDILVISPSGIVNVVRFNNDLVLAEEATHWFWRKRKQDLLKYRGYIAVVNLIGDGDFWSIGRGSSAVRIYSPEDIGDFKNRIFSYVPLNSLGIQKDLFESAHQAWNNLNDIISMVEMTGKPSKDFKEPSQRLVSSLSEMWQKAQEAVDRI